MGFNSGFEGLNHRDNSIFVTCANKRRPKCQMKIFHAVQESNLMDITTCQMLNICQRFDGRQWLHFQCRQLNLKDQGTQAFFPKIRQIHFNLSGRTFRKPRIVFDIDARTSKFMWPDVLIHVSGVGPVPPRKSVPHISCWTERRVQLDCNVPPGQWHPDSVRSLGVLWRTRQTERQTWSQLCGKQDEEGELRCCPIATDY